MDRNMHNLIIAETGGGKTLAYLLPLIETCIRVKQNLKTSLKRGLNQPVGIILVPTRELAFQTYSTLNKLLSVAQPRTDREKILSEINIVCGLHQNVIESKRKASSKRAFCSFKLGLINSFVLNII